MVFIIENNLNTIKIILFILFIIYFKDQQQEDEDKLNLDEYGDENLETVLPPLFETELLIEVFYSKSLTIKYLNLLIYKLSNLYEKFIS